MGQKKDVPKINEREEEECQKKKVTEYENQNDNDNDSSLSSLSSTSSSATTTFSAILNLNNHQSTKDLTSSPYLAASKYQFLNGNSASSSSSSSSSSSFNKNKNSVSLQPSSILNQKCSNSQSNGSLKKVKKNIQLIFLLFKVIFIKLKRDWSFNTEKESFIYRASYKYFCCEYCIFKNNFWNLNDRYKRISR